MQREQQRGSLLPGVVSDIRDEYEAAIRQEQQDLESLEVRPGYFRRQQIRQARRLALLTQRSALLELRRQGQLSAEALFDLLEEVDAELVRIGESAGDDDEMQDLQARQRDQGDDVDGAAREPIDQGRRAGEAANRTD